MTYQQAGRIAILKRVVGWVIFIPALLSTLISVLKFMYAHSEKQEGINAVMLDFTHVMIDMMRVEGVEDQLILEKAKGAEGLTREQIESRIVVPHHTIFLQFFPLYILPVIIIVLGYFFFSLLGFM
ncbi:hypothetical protein BXA16_22945 [Salmonella enterica subsp. enterica serovar Typhimurium]|nr:hypothetical protein BXA16_22945 [Salmonella enterica subsp. enterica serovar Typhimurium]